MKKLILIMLAPVFVSACETYGIYSDVKTTLYPVETDFSEEVISVAKDETVLTQQAKVKTVVALADAFNGVIQVNANTAMPVSLEAGTLLYAVTSSYQRQVPGARLYCSTTVLSLPPQDIKGRACLSDEDADNDFDRPWFLYQFSGLTNYAGGSVYGALEPAETSAAYAPADVDMLEPAEISIMFRTAAFQGYFFNLATDGVINNPYQAETAIPPTENLPATIAVNGALIKVLSRKGDVAELQVLRGFNPERPVEAEQPVPPDTSMDVANAVAATTINSFY